MSTNLQTATKVQEALPRSLSVDSVLQRKCDCGNHTAGSQCDACDKKRKITLQRSAISSGPSEGVPVIVHDVLRSPGQPLDSATRTFFEPRFGHDFSHVRVHSDANAGQSARSVNALAYAVGRDIVVQPQYYKPESTEGKRLLAHELTHVLQQGQGIPSVQRQELGANQPIEVNHVSQPLLSRIDPPYPGVIGRCRSMGVPCPAPHFHHGAVCRLVSCSRATTANLPFAISPGICIYQCSDGQICTCVLFGNATSAVCVITLCDSAASASSDGNYEDLTSRAIALAQQKLENAPSEDQSVAEPTMQAKLEVGESGDMYEREADAVAEKVMRMSDPTVSHTGLAGQRKLQAGAAADRYDVIENSSTAQVFASPLAGPFVQRQTPPQPQPAAPVAPVAPNPQTQQPVIEAARAAAAIRTQVALIRLRGIVPPGPPGRPDPGQQMRERARRLARVMFNWDNPNMDQIEEVVGSMVTKLTNPQVMVAGRNDPECGNRAAYVRGLQPPIVLCPTFFTDSPEQQTRTMIHESAHLARIGSGSLGESYCIFFDCETSCGGFDSADSWTHFVHCLSGQTADQPTPVQGRPGGSGGGGTP
jgi:hypothetical protein